MLMQNFGATIKKHYGMLWYFLEWPIVSPRNFEVQVEDIIWKQHQEQLSSRFIPPTLS